MKANHQEVDVVDMSGVKEEMRRARIAAVEESAASMTAEELVARRAAAEAMPTAKEVEMEMESRFIKGATKGIAMKVKGKKKM